MSNFENEKNVGKTPLSVPEIRREVMHKEVSADFVLPDYMGDIKRVLKYTADATPCNKVVSADEASFLAAVTFRVTYLDSEDMLTEAVFTSDGEFSLKLPANSLDADAQYSVSSLAVRLGGPRKIGAKASIGCETSVTLRNEICDRTEYDGAEMLKKEIEIHTAEYLKCAEREYAEEIDKLEELEADDVEIVKSYAKAFIDGVHKTDGGVNLSGYADAFCILRSDDGLKRLEKRIPIEEHLECELCENSEFIPSAFVTGVNVNLNNVTDNDECALSVVMTLTVECMLTHHYNEKITVVKDAFYEGCKNECSYKKMEFSRLGDFVYDKAHMSFSIERGEEPLHDIIEKDMTLKNLRYESDENEINVLCDGELHLITRGNEPEICASRKEKAEFSKKYRIGASENGRVYLSAVPCEVSVSFDAEKIYVEAEILVSLMREIREREDILFDIEYENKCESAERKVFVYYPEKDDTIWSVSKKYAVSPSVITERNALSGDDTFVNGRIIISR